MRATVPIEWRSRRPSPPNMTSLQITNPATGRAFETIACDDAASVREKFSAARDAQSAWARQPLSTRLECLRRFRAALVTETESLARLLTREMGKPITQSRNELRGVLDRIDFFLAESPRRLRPEHIARLKHPNGSVMTERITHEPLGVVTNISAWNYPYFVGSNVFVPALLAGNAVLYKPSEFTALTGQAIARLLHAAGVPRDVFVPLIGTGEVGRALLAEPIDGVFFTGSHATGRAIARQVAGRMIRVQLELGGKDPAYVCDDANLATAAASLADGAFYNTGQSCCSVERIYVHERIHADFVAAFVAEVRRFRVGDPLRDDTYIGPLTRAAQIDVLEDQIADAMRCGGRVALGGARVKRRGNYFAPTVVLDANQRMKVMREESFGPVIGIMAVRDDAEAIAVMNDTSYGLTAGVYSTSRRRAENILREIRSGTVYWNCCDRVSPRLPWSGVGHSGIGVTLSHYGITAFTRPKAWHLSCGPKVTG